MPLLQRRDLLLAVAAMPVAASVDADLRKGVNLTNWFRYPPSQDPAAVAAYLSDGAMRTLGRTGFDFVRLAVQPGLMQRAPPLLGVLQAAVRRLHRHRMSVIIGPHPVSWRLETNATDRAALVDFWRALAPMLAPLDPRLTIPEVLNEPVFHDDPDVWAELQRQVHAVIRASLPGRRIVLAGNDWGGIDGMLRLQPIADPDAIYSFHFYEPAELTALAAYRPGLDRVALARQPFPMTGTGCAAAEVTQDAPTSDLIRFVCAMNWDPARIDARIGAVAHWGARHGAKLMLGEFGATAALNRSARLGWLAAVRQSCERRGIAWALWGYDDAMGFGARPPRTALLDAGVLAALGLL